ncbi:hypothetical protein DHD05_18170 [Arenibacter sp. N53]|nr:hypothetical protein [Arenibacter sp. N53]
MVQFRTAIYNIYFKVCFAKKYWRCETCYETIEKTTFIRWNN